MFVISASIDDNLTFVEREYGADDLTGGLVAELVRSLDGARRTLVTLSPGGEAHMAIGGDAGLGMVVYMTADNMSFHNLHTRRQIAQASISLVAGGQPGDYDACHVVTLDEALAAALCYAEAGELNSELRWDLQASN